MRIDELSGKTIFLEDMKDLTTSDIRGMDPARIVLTQSGKTILDEYYYPGFDGEISLDYRDVVSRMTVPALPDLQSVEIPPEKSNGYVAMKLSLDGDEYDFTVNVFSADSEKMLSDIDYLAIPRDARIILNVYAGWSSYNINLLIGGRSVGLLSKTGLNGNGKGFYTYLFDIRDLPVGRKPFRLVVNRPTGEDLVTCVYQSIEDDANQYIFSGRLGGYVYFPMTGALEIAPEYEIENGRYSDKTAKVYSTLTPVFIQHTGGLTLKASAVLSELLTSDHIYHLCGTVWRRIVIEEASVTFQNIDSLNYANFHFRYMDDIPVYRTMQ